MNKEKAQYKKYKKQIKKMQKERAKAEALMKKQEATRFKAQVKLEKRIPGYHYIFTTKEERKAFESKRQTISMSEYLTLLSSSHGDGIIRGREEKKMAHMLIIRNIQMNSIAVAFCLVVGVLITAGVAISAGGNNSVISKAIDDYNKKTAKAKDDGVLIPKATSYNVVTIEGTGVEDGQLTSEQKERLEKRLNKTSEEPIRSLYDTKTKEYDLSTDNSVYTYNQEDDKDLFVFIHKLIDKYTDLDKNKEINDQLAKEQNQ